MGFPRAVTTQLAAPTTRGRADERGEITGGVEITIHRETTAITPVVRTRSGSLVFTTPQPERILLDGNHRSATCKRLRPTGSCSPVAAAAHPTRPRRWRGRNAGYAAQAHGESRHGRPASFPVRSRGWPDRTRMPLSSSPSTMERPRFSCGSSAFEDCRPTSSPVGSGPARGCRRSVPRPLTQVRLDHGQTPVVGVPLSATMRPQHPFLHGGGIQREPICPHQCHRRTHAREDSRTFVRWFARHAADADTRTVRHGAPRSITFPPTVRNHRGSRLNRRARRKRSPGDLSSSRASCSVRLPRSVHSSSRAGTRPSSCSVLHSATR
jgi:hypothetical protein